MSRRRTREEQENGVLSPEKDQENYQEGSQDAQSHAYYIQCLFVHGRLLQYSICEALSRRVWFGQNPRKIKDLFEWFMAGRTGLGASGLVFYLRPSLSLVPKNIPALRSAIRIFGRARFLARSETSIYYRLRCSLRAPITRPVDKKACLLTGFLPKWRGGRGSNPRPSDRQSDVLNQLNYRPLKCGYIYIIPGRPTSIRFHSRPAPSGLF